MPAIWITAISNKDFGHLVRSIILLDCFPQKLVTVGSKSTKRFHDFSPAVTYGTFEVAFVIGCTSIVYVDTMFEQELGTIVITMLDHPLQQRESITISNVYVGSCSNKHFGYADSTNSVAFGEVNSSHPLPVLEELNLGSLCATSHREMKEYVQLLRRGRQGWLSEVQSDCTRILDRLNCGHCEVEVA
ncbi:hypothetical protein DERF_004188 [Dermatophagoides farinae]|uniref:Uncharacterized protein n=1 Tax=Dermatophagoides farinae TaxID=6954 RepID=A0A922L7G7_DERFA|nr:hypothetical protein DERF_004188 [Dermatophagoides farinae]